MKINFEIREEDYINFNLYHLENSKAQKNTFNLLRYAIPVIFSIPIYFIGTGLFKQPSIYWIIIATIFPIIWIVTYPKQYRKIIKKETKKILMEGDNSSIFGKKTLEINDENIILEGEFNSEKVSIKSIKDIKIYEDMILIYTSGFMALIIPRRDLDDEIDKQFIEELRKIHISE